MLIYEYQIDYYIQSQSQTQLYSQSQTQQSDYFYSSQMTDNNNNNSTLHWIGFAEKYIKNILLVDINNIKCILLKIQIYISKVYIYIYIYLYVTRKNMNLLYQNLKCYMTRKILLYFTII